MCFHLRTEMKRTKQSHFIGPAAIFAKKMRNKNCVVVQFLVSIVVCLIEFVGCYVTFITTTTNNMYYAFVCKSNLFPL